MMNVNNIFRKSNNPAFTEGERFLAEYLNELRLRYVPQQVIPNLKNDHKTYRIADFYLTDYRLYVEFHGGWNNSKEERQRYKEKNNVYRKNRVPCIFIYPDNLGTIEYTFPKRAIEVMKTHKMSSELLRFRTKYVWEDKKANIITFSLIFWIFAFGAFTWKEDCYLQLLLISVLIYQPYVVYKYLKRELGV